MDQRCIKFEAVFNFRDLGGYKGHGGRIIGWRRVFRSGTLYTMTKNDLDKLRREIRLTSVLDLRSNLEIDKQGLGLLTESKIKYFNVSLINDGGNREANERRYKSHNNMAEFYIHLTRQKEFGKLIIQALEIIADSNNLPLVFCCSAGKDRAGILAALLLSSLGVIDEDISYDFSLTAPYIASLLNRMKNDARLREEARSLPDYFWQVSPDLMARFLASIKHHYGSTQRYLEEQGAESSLFDRLEKALMA